MALLGRTRNSGWWRQERVVYGARVTSDERARGEEEDAVTMLVAMLLHGGVAADDARRAGGGQCYTQKGADDNGKQQERVWDDGSFA